jgi:hypothetical protein
MSCNPGWWKAVCQVPVHVLSGLVILATAGIWYFGRREDKKKEPLQKQEDAEKERRQNERFERMEAGISELVTLGQISREDANKGLHIVVGERVLLREKMQVEIGKGQQENER